jgi:UrcA family protein
MPEPRKELTMFKSLLTAAALATVLAPTAAMANPHDTILIEVDVRDLDLSNPADQERADRRVANAARSLCQTSGRRSLEVRAAETACIEQAIASVRPQGI